jgi:hypothetical protein
MGIGPNPLFGAANAGPDRRFMSCVESGTWPRGISMLDGAGEFERHHLAMARLFEKRLPLTATRTFPLSCPGTLSAAPLPATDLTAAPS